VRQAAIFDVDGVLVDSYRAHFESWRLLGRELGFELSEPDFASTFGRTSREIIRRFRPGPELEEGELRRLDERKEALYRELVSRSFPAMDGARELVESLAREGILVAVGSSGPPENVALALERLGIRPYVSAVVTGRDVRRGKPDPEVFLLAAERLGVRPDRSVVVEDAPAGIVAAKAAGMKAVAFLSTGRAERDFEGCGADLLVRSLRELDAGRLRSLLAGLGTAPEPFQSPRTPRCP
jgi:beta-phosphoglucomutase